jgi:hypothetical protein
VPPRAQANGAGPDLRRHAHRLEDRRQVDLSLVAAPVQTLRRTVVPR